MNMVHKKHLEATTTTQQTILFMTVEKGETNHHIYQRGKMKNNTLWLLTTKSQGNKIKTQKVRPKYTTKGWIQIDA